MLPDVEDLPVDPTHDKPKKHAAVAVKNSSEKRMF